MYLEKQKLNLLQSVLTVLWNKIANFYIRRKKISDIRNLRTNFVSQKITFLNLHKVWIKPVLIL